MTKVAVVILNYNGRAYLEKFLPVLVRCTPKAEIVVADNASSDDSVSYLTNHFSEISLIQLHENYGFAEGYNQALKKVNATCYALLNSDVEVTEGWLDPLVQFLDEHPDYAACQPKILDYHNKGSFEYAGAAGGFLDTFGYPWCRGRIFDTIEHDDGQYDHPVDVNWTSGACMLIRSEVFHKQGGFDADFFAHMEEIDLCWRMANSGYKMRSVPSSVVYHVGGGTLSKTSPFKTYLNFRNGINLLIKNMPMTSLVWKLPVRVMLDWIAALKFLREGYGHSFAIIKAHFKVVAMIMRTLRKRTQPDDRFVQNRSIVFGYYVRGKKKYTDYQ